MLNSIRDIEAERKLNQRRFEDVLPGLLEKQRGQYIIFFDGRDAAGPAPERESAIRIFNALKPNATLCWIARIEEGAELKKINPKSKFR